MSILLSSKTLVDVLQFTLKNDISKFSAYNNYYCHNTGCIFEPIFIKFTWFLRVHIWMNFFFFLRNNRFNRTTDMGGKCARKTGFLDFFEPVSGFLRKKYQSCNRYTFLHRKGYIHFFRLTPQPLKNCSLPPPKKKISSAVILENIIFLEKIVT